MNRTAIIVLATTVVLVGAAVLLATHFAKGTNTTADTTPSVSSTSTKTSANATNATKSSDGALPNLVADDIEKPEHPDSLPPAPPIGAEKKTDRADNKTPSPINYGHAKPIKGDENPSAASVLEALNTKTHPERLSVMLAPTETFDKAAYEADALGYCSVVIPGRVFQTATPAPGVPELKPLGGTLAVAGQSDPVVLSVQGVPESPVTFTSLDLGYFQENKLNSITVRADKNGTASATFTGGPGTIADVNILAGSPLSTGQVRFKVVVQVAGAVVAAPKK